MSVRRASGSRVVSGGGARLRSLGDPRPVAVRTDARGDPVAVREGRSWRRVDAVREHWRIDDEWWRRPVSRVYHQVILDDGGLRTLYRDLAGGGWFLQG